MENRRNMDGGEDERWGGISWGLWLRATSFLGNRSSVHVIRQGRVGGPGSISSLLICLAVSDLCKMKGGCRGEL